MLAVVLSFDRFPMRLLGCYGNTTLELPCLNHIAAESLVFDQHFGEDFSPQPANHAWWTGCPQDLFADDLHPVSRSLAGQLKAANVDCLWLTDEATPREIPHPVDGPILSEDDFESLLKSGHRILNEWGTRTSRSQLLWLKAGESLWNGSSTDQAEAVVMLDQSLSPLWEALQDLGATQEVLFVLTAGRGMPFESLAVVRKNPSPWAEEYVHLPLILYHSHRQGGERCTDFTQPIDLSATLLKFLANPDSPIDGSSHFHLLSQVHHQDREFLVAGSSPGWKSLRNKDFHLVIDNENPESDAPRTLLFVKPDDIWDWHNVAAQEPEMTEDLTGKLDAFIRDRKVNL